MVSIVVHLFSFPKLPFWVPAWPTLLKKKKKSMEEKIPLALTSQNQGKEAQECLR